jgi:hypothetical protein
MCPNSIIQELSCSYRSLLTLLTFLVRVSFIDCKDSYSTNITDINIVFGGLLSNPIRKFPSAFGPNSSYGGTHGVWWMREYPFALPNLVCAILLLVEAIIVVRYLRETLNNFQPLPYPLLSYKGLAQYASDLRNSSHGYRLLSPPNSPLSDKRADSVINSPVSPAKKESFSDTMHVYTRPSVWTPNVLWTLLSVAIFDFHMGAFSSLFITFLSTARQPLSSDHHISFYHFAGGLSFSPSAIGFALAILGIVGLILQVTLYPWANSRFGLMRCFRLSLFLFPIAYFLAPYLSILPSTSAPPLPSAGIIVWTGISVMLLFQVTARTFALPASILLINNSAPDPSVLATIHGLGQATSSAFRTLGPIVTGFWYGLGLRHGTVVCAWWVIAAVSAQGCLVSFFVRDGAAGSAVGDTGRGRQRARTVGDVEKQQIAVEVEEKRAVD